MIVRVKRSAIYLEAAWRKSTKKRIAPKSFEGAMRISGRYWTWTNDLLDVNAVITAWKPLFPSIFLSFHSTASLELHWFATVSCIQLCTKKSTWTLRSATWQSAKSTSPPVKLRRSKTQNFEGNNSISFPWFPLNHLISCTISFRFNTTLRSVLFTLEWLSHWPLFHRILKPGTSKKQFNDRCVSNRVLASALRSPSGLFSKYWIIGLFKTIVQPNKSASVGRIRSWRCRNFITSPQ